ncbi:hypothetical protein J0X15_16175 [Roseibium sp. CAU 1637]|uniref:Uncharacterized protein n=1 Tax=Roseibium limicola TaxID=2816037 RepID=A0A939EPX1_9HYPH|nr:hypothetical protein [Roseibium limicola]
MFIPVFFGSGLGAQAQDIDSVYTKIILETCRSLAMASEESTFGGSWSCDGYRGTPVSVAEGDLRMFVSFGPGAAKEPAVNQTLSGFNTIGETLEWRLRDGVAFATILRWHVSAQDGRNPGQVLVVTQLVPGATCQIARVDAQANRNANALAREAADRLAGNTSCEEPPKILGKASDFVW